MQQEVEVRFLNVGYDELRRKLKAAGAKQQYPMRFMKRVIIDYPDQRLQKLPDATSFIRVRDEGGKTMLTYKHVVEGGKFETHEIEVEVSSYDKTIELFKAIGLEIISEQHSKRESWYLDGCEVTLDEWPWLPPTVEIEGPTETALQSVTEKLGFRWDERIYGNVVNAYRMVYPGMGENESIRDVKKLTFEEMPKWLKARQHA